MKNHEWRNHGMRSMKTLYWKLIECLVRPEQWEQWISKVTAEYLPRGTANAYVSFNKR